MNFVCSSHLLTRLKVFFFQCLLKQLLPLGHFSCPFFLLCCYYLYLEMWRLGHPPSSKTWEWSAFMYLQNDAVLAPAAQYPDDFRELSLTTPRNSVFVLYILHNFFQLLVLFVKWGFSVCLFFSFFYNLSNSKPFSFSILFSFVSGEGEG